MDSHNFASLSPAHIPAEIPPSVPHIRLSWDEKLLTRQAYAGILNDRGGTLEIVHKDRFVELPLPLPEPPASVDLSHFHLDVIADLEATTWSNAHFNFVYDHASPITCTSTYYSHNVFVTASAGVVALVMDPLPNSYIVGLAQPCYHQSDKKQKMDFQQWFSHLGQVTGVSHLRPKTQGAVNYDIQTGGKNYPPESTGTEWKFPTTSIFLPLSMIKMYLTESLLNAPETPRRLFFGLEGGTKCVIGCFIRSFPVFASNFATDCLAPQIFPTLETRWFHVTFHEVPSSLPSNWSEEIISTAEIPCDILHCACLIFQGCVASAQYDTCDADTDQQIRIFVPQATYQAASDQEVKSIIGKSKSISKTKRNAAWKILKKMTWTTISWSQKESHHPLFSSLSSVSPRYVVEVEFKDEMRYSGAFFRTEETGKHKNVDDLRIPFPVPSSSHQAQPQTLPGPYFTTMDPCAVWLRAAAGVPFEMKVSELFFSPLFRKIIVNSPSCEVKGSLDHYLLGRPLDNMVTIDGQDTHYQLDHLPLSSSYPGLIVASLSSLDTLRKIIKSDWKHPRWLVVLLVDPAMPNCRLSVMDALRLLEADATVVAIRALVSPNKSLYREAYTPWGSESHAQSADPASNSSSQEPAITFDRIPTTDTISFVALAMVDKNFGAWLARETLLPPGWELLRAGRIHSSIQARLLSDRITESWKHGSQKRLRALPMMKVFPASGATCLLRSVAYDQHSKDPSVAVLWVSHMTAKPSTQACIDEIEKAISSSSSTSLTPSKKILLCTDELGKKNTSVLLAALQHLTSQGEDLCVIWLLLRSLPSAALFSNLGHSNDELPFFVSPIVDHADVVPLASTLRSPGNGAALDAICKIAHTSSRIEDRHMFVFALAATKGVCIPIQQWVRERSKVLAGFGKPLLDVALSFAFVSAVAVDHTSQCVSDDPLARISYESLGKGRYEEAILAFRTLFSSNTFAPKASPSSMCIHPFVARLFLTNHFQLFWNNEYLDWQSLCDAWHLTSTTLSENSNCHDTLRSLLYGRARHMQFSPLVLEAWSATSKLPPNTAVEQIIEGLVKLPHVQNIMGLHEHILKARLYRCAAQMIPNKPQPLILLALAAAREAHDLSQQSNNRGEKATASQTLAIMHGFAHSVSPTKFHSSLAQCDTTLKQLAESSNDPEDKDNIIVMGRKWCPSDHWTNQKLAQSRDAYPEDVEQLIVRGWTFHPVSNGRYRLFSTRDVRQVGTKAKRRPSGRF